MGKREGEGERRKKGKRGDGGERTREEEGKTGRHTERRQKYHCVTQTDFRLAMILLF